MDEMYMMELATKGYYCSQILMKAILDAEEKENSDLIRAMGGLIGGLGFNQRICGALTGGICAIGYFTCKGEDDEIEDENAKEMIKKLIEWFETEGTNGKGTECKDIIGGDLKNQMKVCPNLVSGTLEKVFDILAEYGYDV